MCLGLTVHHRCYYDDRSQARDTKTRTEFNNTYNRMVNHTNNRVRSKTESKAGPPGFEPESEAPEASILSKLYYEPRVC